MEDTVATSLALTKSTCISSSWPLISNVRLALLMPHRSRILSVLTVLVLTPLVGLAMGFGAWFYADSLTHSKRQATASFHVVGAPLHTMNMQSTDGSQTMPSRTLYMVYCAQCHGDTGDGNGTRVLDRPARSFTDGGFSFGNTATALYRTISNGIGGTPMPAFADTMSSQDRLALAHYVRSLAPPELVVSQADRILMVTNVPVVVRGHLPALGEGLPEYPRGLLVGTTDGLSFQYSADDVRLLAVRQGDFVERTDWTGRGGTPLRPMGQIIDLIDGGQPSPTIDLGPGTTATLVGTSVRGNRAIVRTRIQIPGHDDAIEAEEWTEAVSLPLGVGYARHLQLHGLVGAPEATLHLNGSGLPHIATMSDPDNRKTWVVHRRPDGQCLVQGVEADFDIEVLNTSGDIHLPLPANTSVALQLTTLIIPEWNDEAEQSLLAGAAQ